MAQPQPATLPHYTLSEYLTLERYSDVKHEYLDGLIVAMTGATKAHDIVTTNLRTLLANHLRGTPCRVAGSDLKLFVEAANRCFYPDLMVVCSDPHVGNPYQETDARLIVEVLSESTAEYDHTVKRDTYLLLSSLQEYWLVTQEQAEIVVWRRVGQRWESHRYCPSDTVPMLGGEFTVPVAALYERL